MSRDGALLAARVAVLAAEVADVERYRRGRAYARQGAVLMTTVRDGVLSGSVLGSRPEAYEVELRVRGAGARRGPLPARTDISARCSCPDDVPACKHAVAVLLSFAEMVAQDPGLLEEWTGPLDAAQEWDAAPQDEDEEQLPEFFGTRRPHDLDAVAMPRLDLEPRPVPDGELSQLALDALDHAVRALHALYG